MAKSSFYDVSQRYSGEFAPQRGNWLRLKHDVPGDIDLRETWAQGIKDAQPQGIIYMIDGRHDDQTLRRDLDVLRSDVLSCYEGGLGALSVLHVLMNYSDLWATTPNETRRRISVVRSGLDAIIDSSPEWARLRIDVLEVQLSPKGEPWEEADRAMQHFGADLAT